MSNDNTQTPQTDPLEELFRFIRTSAVGAMHARHGSDKGKEAAVRVFAAIRTAISTAKRPQAFAECTDISILNCINLSIDYNLFPGGPNPMVYLVPQAPSKGSQPEMQWRITSRGLSALAARAGYSLNAVPVAAEDDFEINMGSVARHRPKNPAKFPTAANLIGYAVVVRRVGSSEILFSPWVPAEAITDRRAKSRDQSVWNDWFIEMGWKTAVKFCFARGTVVIEAIEQVVSRDTQYDLTEDEPAQAAAAPAARAFAVPAAAPRQIAAPVDDWTAAIVAQDAQALTVVDAAPPTQSAAPVIDISALKARRNALARQLTGEADDASAVRTALGMVGITPTANPDADTLQRQITAIEGAFPPAQAR
jgi:recombinational DNA repair protein RecT